ncbi:hypothetical protein NARC_30254 [Candidatus Nitrosocosmicus arcticus]|uniref:Uncharacterized protein n=1 Tax=Candidatus Nitrosocosmicus arcticus TaxID=2035267 RepID=A0A557SY59_9ARCH|nr:hypothetical protein NARC_30254 [Candidatus Nitrosocosmicus arcticus]
MRIDFFRTERISSKEILARSDLTAVVVQGHKKIIYWITAIKISKYYHMLLFCSKQ